MHSVFVLRTANTGSKADGHVRCMVISTFRVWGEALSIRDLAGKVEMPGRV